MTSKDQQPKFDDTDEGVREQGGSRAEHAPESREPEELGQNFKGEMRLLEEQTIKEGKGVLKEGVDSVGLPADEVEDVARETGVEQAVESVQTEMEEVRRAAEGEITELISPDTLRGSDDHEKTKEWGTIQERLIKNEQEYITTHKDRVGLEQRYADERTSATNVLRQVTEFGKERGIQYDALETLEGKDFDDDTRGVILDAIRKDIDAFLLDKEKGRFKEQKHKSVTQEVSKYLDLIRQAQREGDIRGDVDAQAVMSLVKENVSALAYQDRVASENLLGDHGIRHLVDHNIVMGDQILDQLQERGQEVRAVDRLMLHQVMIDHDLGYAMDPVREGINAGKFGVDKGHNVLAAKFIQERGGDPNDALQKVFSPDQIDAIHEGILHHDSSKVVFRLGDASFEARRANMESATHIADNTHAFEDKLPELLYEVPESLETIRLLKSAGEIGDQTLVDELKERLKGVIEKSHDFSRDDKMALTKAVEGLQSESYKFSVSRICGNKPSVAIDGEGKALITVQESAIHQETMALFAQEAYDQLRKFIADLTGVDKNAVDLDKDMIEAGPVTIKLEKGEHSASKRTDYQERIEEIIKDERFREYTIYDNTFSEQQKRLEKIVKLKSADELKYAANLLRAGGDTRQDQEIVEEQVAEIKKKRREALLGYTSPV